MICNTLSMCFIEKSNYQLYTYTKTQLQIVRYKLGELLVL